MRISVVQMNPGADKAENIAQARRLIGEAVEADRPDIVVPARSLGQPGRRPHRAQRQRRVAAGEGLQRAGRPRLRVPARDRPRGQGARARRLDHRAGTGEAVQHHRGVRPRRPGDRALPQDAPVRHRRPRRHRLSRKQHLRRRRRGGHLRGGRREGGLRDLLRPALPRPVLEAARAGRRGDLPAVGVHARHRQGPLGGDDPLPRDRDAVLVRRPRHLGQAPGRQGRAALHLRPLDDRRPVGPRGGQGVRRHRLGHRRGSTRTVTARVRRDMPVLEHRKRV